MKLKLNPKKIFSLDSILLIVSSTFIVAISVSLLWRYVSAKRNTVTSTSIVFDKNTPHNNNPISFEKDGITLGINKGNIVDGYLASISPQSFITNSVSSPLINLKSVTFKVKYIHKQTSWFMVCLSDSPITTGNDTGGKYYKDYFVNIILDRIYTIPVKDEKYTYFSIVNLKGSGGIEMDLTLDYIQFDF